MKVNIQKESMKIGLNLGVFIFLIYSLTYIINPKVFLNEFFDLFIRIIVIGFGIYSINRNKKLLKGLISFKEVFTSYFACIASAYFIVNIGMIFIFVILDPITAEMLHNEKIILLEISKLDLLNSNNDTSILDLLIENLKNTSSYSISFIIQGYIAKLLGNSIFGLIISLLFKTNNSQTA